MISILVCVWIEHGKSGCLCDLGHHRRVCFGSESMTKLIDIRHQEMLCRERALVELERKEFWLEQADEWAQRALAEIASELQAMAKEGQTRRNTSDVSS
jgi:hypothetical protein